jgi:predicted GNAT family N-acyltransferase
VSSAEQVLRHDAAQASPREVAMSGVTIRWCSTADELEAVRRLRYEVYVEEMGRPQPHADHEARRIADALDETGWVLAVEHEDEVVGTLRVNRASDGLGAYEALYGLAGLSAADARSTAIATATMFRPHVRKGQLSTELYLAVYAMLRAYGVHTLFVDCNPPLVSMFERLGFRRVRDLEHPLYGDVRLLRHDLLDREHLRAVRSPLVPLLDNYRPHLPRNFPMTTMSRLQTDFQAIAERFHAHPACDRFRRGDATVAEYASLMVSVAQQARENPQIQAYATAFFRGHQRDLVRTFFKHAVSEIGHDQLAADDAGRLGQDTSDLFRRQPRAGAVALTAYAYYAISHLSAVSYLGYLFFLEFLPTTFGAEYMAALDRMGVPMEARTFLMDHATVDIGHNKLMERYVSELITTEEEYEAVHRAMEVTGTLYAQMIGEAFALARDVAEQPRFAPWERSYQRAAERAHGSV